MTSLNAVVIMKLLFSPVMALRALDWTFEMDCSAADGLENFLIITCIRSEHFNFRSLTLRDSGCLFSL